MERTGATLDVPFRSSIPETNSQAQHLKCKHVLHLLASPTDASDRWNWEGANLDTCCKEQGYDTTMEGCGCEIVPHRRPEACSEAPSSSFVGEKKTSDDISDPT